MKIEIKDPHGTVVQSLDLTDGDYTISVTGASTLHKNFQGAFAPSSIEAYLAFFLGIASVILYSANQYFNTAHLNLEATDNLKNSIEILIGIVFSVTIVSFLSRALTHQFQVWRCALLVISSFLVYFTLSQNLLGLRWALPKIFWIREIYNLFLVAAIGALIWQVIKLFLPQMKLLWRKLITSFLVVFILIYSLLNYLPFRREYIFYHIDTPPPRPSALDSTPMTTDQFIDGIVKQIE